MRAKLALAACAALLIGGGGLAVGPPGRFHARPGCGPEGLSWRPARWTPPRSCRPRPSPGEARYEADRKTFLATRALKDGPRWKLAQADNDERAILADFGCALGFTPTPETNPRLVGLLMKLRHDVIDAVNKPKELYKRQRPFLIDAGDICIAKTDALAASPDYPSGHTTWGWTVGLILAEADPDHATAILVRPGRSAKAAWSAACTTPAPSRPVAPTPRPWWRPCTAPRPSATTWTRCARRSPRPARKPPSRPSATPKRR